jgi:hypothetical protein
VSATIAEAQSLRNLRTARANVASSLGIDPDNLTPDARTGYNKAVALVVLAHPQSFSETTLEVARNISRGNYTMQEDDGFSWSDVASGTVDNLASALDFGVLGKIGLLAAAAAAVWFFVLPEPVKAKAAGIFKAPTPA